MSALLGDKLGEPRGWGPHSGHLLRRATERDIRAFRWLCPSFIDVEETLQDLVDRRLPGTCEWIAQDEKLQRWVESEEGAMLGMRGEIGCGKSVLAAHIITTLKSTSEIEGLRPPAETRDYSVPRFYKQQLGPYHWDDLYNTPSPLAYIFVDALPVEARDVSTVLSLLLSQLCRQNSDLLESVTKRVERDGGAYASPVTLGEIFRTDIDANFPKFYLVLDGMDRVGLLVKDFLEQCLSHKKAKILVLGRHLNALMFPGGVPILDMPASQVRRDVQRYVTHLLDTEIKETSPQTRQIYTTFLTPGEGTSFLWPTLTIHLLESTPDLPLLLSTAPLDIPGIYTLLLRNLTATSTSPEHLSLSLRTLLLLSTTTRPLSLTELQTALSLTESNPFNPETTHSFHFNTLLTTLESFLHTTLPGLIHITHHPPAHGSMYSVFHTTVSLIHGSLLDFLFSPLLAPSTASELGLPLKRQLIHTSIARLGLTYLSLSHFSLPNKRIQYQRGARHDHYASNGEGFLSYAAIYTFHHLAHSGATGHYDNDMLLELQYFMCATPNLATWRSYISASNTSARFVGREGGEGGKEIDMDLWLPGFGRKFGEWIAGFHQTKNGVFGPMLTVWRDNFMEGVRGGDERRSAAST